MLDRAKGWQDEAADKLARARREAIERQRAQQIAFEQQVADYAAKFAATDPADVMLAQLARDLAPKRPAPTPVGDAYENFGSADCKEGNGL